MAQIAAGYRHTCALAAGGGVTCWGNGEYGTLGNGTTTNSSVPVDVSGLTNGVSVIDSGFYHSCAQTSDGGVKCWGNNERGQLGDGTTTDSSVPVEVPALATGVTAIAAGGGHTCALTREGGVKCWGNNEAGQLGDGTTTDSRGPVDVRGLASGASAITAGAAHTCALTSRGGVLCWGDQIHEANGSPVPVEVSRLASGVTAIAAGDDHTCALTNGGGVICWGADQLGQLGNGTNPGGFVPVDVSGLASGVSAITAGGIHSCALTSRGDVRCWGYNAYGQLGDASTSVSLTPVDVAGLRSAVTAIAAGGNHTCALTRLGEVQCWGRNAYGQLGDGTTTNSSAPMEVVFASRK